MGDGGVWVGNTRGTSNSLSVSDGNISFSGSSGQWTVGSVNGGTFSNNG